MPLRACKKSMEVRAHAFGSQITLTLNPVACVATLKTLLHRTFALPPPLQVLRACGHVLKDADRVGFVVSGSAVEVTVDSASAFPLRYTVCLPDREPIQVLVRLNDSVERLKDLIFQSTGIEPEKQRLQVKNKRLSNGQSISEVFRPGDFVITLLLPNYFQVTVKIDCADNSLRDRRKAGIAVVTCGSEFVGCLKSRLETSTDFGFKLPTLSFHDCELRDADTLDDYSISAGATLIVKSPGFIVWLKIFGKAEEPALVHRFSRVADLGPHQWILHNGQPLPHNQKVVDLVERGAVLECGDVLLHACTGNIERVSMTVPSTIKIASLCDELARRLRWRPLALVFGGVTLIETRQLFEYGCGQEGTIEVVHPSEKRIWIESETDRIELFASELSVAEAMRLFREKTGSSNRFEWALQNGRLLQETDKVSAGTMLELRNSVSSILVQISLSDRTLFAAAQETETFHQLQTFVRRLAGGGDLYLDQQYIEESRTIGRELNGKLLFLRSGEVQHCFICRDGKALFLPFAPDTPERLVRSRLQEELLTQEELSGCALQETRQQSIKGEHDLVLWLETDDRRRRFLTVPSLAVTVGELKARYKHRLLFARCFLEDSMTLAECDITQGTIIHMLREDSDSDVSMSESPDKYVYVQRLRGDRHLVRLHSGDSLEAFSAFLRLHFTCTDFVLLSRGQLVSTLQTLASGSLIHLLQSTDEAVVVRASNGDVTFAALPRSATVAQAKEATGTPPALKLVFRGQKLAEAYPLAAYALTPVSEVFAVGPSEYYCCIKRLDQDPLQFVLSQRSLSANRITEHLKNVLEEPLVNPRYYLNGKRWQQYDYASLSGDIYIVPASYFSVQVVLLRGLQTYVFREGRHLVRSLREEAAGKLGVTASLRLFFRNAVLEDDKSLSQYSISEDCTVQAMLPEDILISFDYEKRFCLAAERSTTVSDVRRDVACFLKAARKSVWLLLKGAIMRDSRTLHSYGFETQATLQVKLHQSLIALHGPQGHSFASSSSFAELQEFRMQNCADFSGPLFWMGELRDDQTLSQYNLQEDIALSLLLHKTQSQSFILYLRSNKPTRVKVNSSLTVCEVVRLTGRKLRLVLGGGLADISRTLGDYGVTDSAEVLAIQASEMLVRISGLQDLLFAVPANSSILSVKHQVFALIGLAVEMQQFTCNSVQLDDKQVLSGEFIELQLSTIADLVRVDMVNSTIYVPISETVATVKSRVPGARSVYFEDRQLNDEDKLFGTVTLLTVDDIRVYLQSPLSSPMAIYACRSDKVKELKNRIAKKLRLSPIHFQLIAQVRVASPSEFAAVRASAKQLHLWSQ